MEMADLLASLFPDETKTGNNNNNQQQFRFGGGPFGFGGARGAATTATASERMKKKGRVSAVADQRTSSIIVSAASELMPQIGEMITQLDSSPARKQKVFVYSLENAEVEQVQQVLQDMFQRNNTSMNRNANQNSALQQRIQSNNQTTTAGGGNTGFGNSGIGSTGGGLGGGTLR